MTKLWWFHPWRVVTFLVGVGLLLWGAVVDYAPDWDIKISLIMAGATYFLMPWFAHSFRLRKPRAWPYAAGIAVLCSDTTYFLYWGNDPKVDRVANFGASLSLFLMCWLVWHVLPEVWKEYRSPRAV
jgi:hypothetical protein